MTSTVRESATFAAVMTAVIVAYIMLYRQSVHTWSLDPVTKIVSVPTAMPRRRPYSLSLRCPLTVLSLCRKVGSAENMHTYTTTDSYL